MSPNYQYIVYDGLPKQGRNGFHGVWAQISAKKNHHVIQKVIIG
jgi:hypothetical protein